MWQAIPAPPAACRYLTSQMSSKPGCSTVSAPESRTVVVSILSLLLWGCNLAITGSCWIPGERPARHARVWSSERRTTVRERETSQRLMGFGHIALAGVIDVCVEYGARGIPRCTVRIRCLGRLFSQSASDRHSHRKAPPVQRRPVLLLYRQEIPYSTITVAVERRPEVHSRTSTRQAPCWAERGSRNGRERLPSTIRR